MTKLIPLVLIPSLFGCRGRSESADDNVITVAVSLNCAIYEEPGAIALPYLSFGVEDLVPQPISVCGSVPDCLLAKTTSSCLPRPEAQVRLMGVSPGAIIGRIHDKGAPTTACADRAIVRLPHATFKDPHDFTWDFAVSSFPAHCSTR